MANRGFYDSQYVHMDERKWQWRELGGSVKAKNIVTIVGDLPVQSIVDIGCGTGAILASLARMSFGQHYYALDITDQAIHIVKHRSDIPNLIEAKVFDGLHIPYKNQQFDLAILSHVVEHLMDPVPLLQEATRVARYMVVEVPLEDNLYTRLKVHLFRSHYREELGHIQWFNQSNFRFLLEHTCGLEIMRMSMVYIPDELYFYRKQGIARRSTILLLGIRKAVRALSCNLYARLLTDHCIALVHAS
ncbi:MAG: class I SAM-dependent methyltransferase [Anaerolineales bacterium]|nr:class I SAM-dependent methyltransferase [Anaerolineales bacterium]